MGTDGTGQLIEALGNINEISNMVVGVGIGNRHNITTANWNRTKLGTVTNMVAEARMKTKKK